MGEKGGALALAFAERRVSQTEEDFCSESGARLLKEKIESYWRARGAPVMISLANAGFSPQTRASRFDIRSDMINGLPRYKTSP